MVEGFTYYEGKIRKMEPFHAFDTKQLKEELLKRLENIEGAVLKFTIEEIRPTECISYDMRRETKIEILGNVPEEVVDNLRKELEDGSK